MQLFALVLLPLIAFAAVPDFELLQGARSSAWRALEEKDIQEVAFYRALFARNFTESVPSDAARIPQVIHYIWLGPSDFPEESLRNVRSWKERHPGWTLKFWTDRRERSAPVEGMEKHLISELELPHVGSLLPRTENYGERSDMLRYEILAREGGVYIDHDVVCYRPFDGLNRQYDFYACLEPPHIAEGQRTRIFACNCIIGAVPQHPILLAALEKLEERWQRVEEAFFESEVSRVMHRTFLSFTEAVRECAADERYKTILFPAAYFFPDRVYSKRLRDSLGIKNYAMACHFFKGFWIKNNPPSHFSALEKAQRAQSRRINRRLNRLTYISSGSFLLSGVLLFTLWRRRP